MNGTGISTATPIPFPPWANTRSTVSDAIFCLIVDKSNTKIRELQFTVGMEINCKLTSAVWKLTYLVLQKSETAFSLRHRISQQHSVQTAPHERRGAFG